MSIFISFLTCLILIILGGSLYFFCYVSKGILRIQHLIKVKSQYATKATTPKRVIIGNSDVLYSFNTDTIEQETGQPTVNFGLNGGLGLGFLLNTVDPFLQPKDEVILCLTYSAYFKPAYGLFAYEYYRMYDKKQLRQFTPRQHLLYFFGNLKLNLTYTQRRRHLSQSGAYLEVSGSKLPEKKNKPLVFPATFKKGEAIKQLEQFVEKCGQKNISVRITYPSTLAFDCYKEEAYLEQLRAYLEKNYEVIGTPWAYLVSNDYIYDSVYHVNDLGQQERTRRLLEELQRPEEQVGLWKTTTRRDG